MYVYRVYCIAKASVVAGIVVIAELIDKTSPLFLTRGCVEGICFVRRALSLSGSSLCAITSKHQIHFSCPSFLPACSA